MYGYDEIGNITKNTQVSSISSQWKYWKDVYGIKPHAVCNTTGTVSCDYNYDANGNLTSGPGKTITYDYDNRPTSINGTSFVYDYSGQRVKKNSTIYIGKLYECTGGSCTKYIFAGSNRIAYKIGSATYYYHTDHLGSSSIITNYSGTRVNELYYYPYGKTRYAMDSSLTHKYTGQEEDEETGLYYYGARYYDPAIGRFISADSIVPDFSNPQSLNRYSYALNNPVVLRDANGHFPVLAILAIGAAIGAISAGIQSDWNVEEMFAGAVVGAVSAGFAVIGGTAIYSITQVELISAMAGGAVGGTLSSVASGGNVLQGMGIGAIAGGVASGIGGLKYGSPYAKLIAQAGSAAVVGGAASELTGGSFSEGASMGALSAAIVWGVEMKSSSTANTGGQKKDAFDLVVNKVEVIEVVSLEAKVTGNILQDINEGVQYYAVCMGEEVVGPGVFEAAGVGGRDYFTYRAWQHAATTSSKTYGTAFLVHPLKSTIVQGFLRWAGRSVPILNIGGLLTSNIKCLVGEYKYLTQ